MIFFKNLGSPILNLLFKCANQGTELLRKYVRYELTRKHQSQR